MAFEGKSVLITGANGGIGGGCAEYFAKEKANLTLVGRNAQKFEKVLANIKQSGVEREPLVIIADVTTDNERIINETIAKYQRLDILINNAGFAIVSGIEDIKMADYDAVFATNVRAVIELTHLAIPHLIKSKGTIVNISSVCGIRAFKGFLAYAMSKAALDQFTRCVALEMADKGVRVNSVNPAAIDTDFHVTAGTKTEEYEARLQYMDAQHPVGRSGTIDEVVNAVAFLCNEKSTFIQGCILPVDGAFAIKSPFN